jgi:hypothetical protein
MPNFGPAPALSVSFTESGIAAMPHRAAIGC